MPGCFMELSPHPVNGEFSRSTRETLCVAESARIWRGLRAECGKRDDLNSVGAPVRVSPVVMTISACGVDL